MNDAILITGAGGGIGLATVRRLDHLGFTVFAGVRTRADGERVRRLVSSRIIPILLDITDPISVSHAADEVARRVGEAGMRALVNNAGLIVEGPVELVPIEEIKRQFDVNLFGHIAVTQAFLPLLRKARGRIINVSAPTGQLAVPFLGILSASKAALDSVNDVLRCELRTWGISVCSIVPGAMRTGIFQRSAAAASKVRQELPADLVSLYTPALAAMAKAAAGQRLQDPEIAANVIVNAIRAGRPRPRYSAGRGAGMAAVLRLLPARVRDALLLRAFGLTDHPKDKAA
jgi:NAD(P)-dependent dehydrogenase (short-subunit alcohol dehydrogenase family)